jgi:flagellar biosynthesis/type III secretory pathway protein FliH
MSFKSFIAPLAATVFVLGPVSAFAQSPAWRQPSDTARYRSLDDGQSYSGIRRAAYDEGYRDGVRKGEQDGRRGARFAYQDERDFQRADRGYHRSFGDRERYRQIFREGYASGYSDGYSRYSPYGRNDGRQGPYAQQGPYGRPQGPYGQQGGYRNPGGYGSGAYYSPAFDNGARDGYEKGQEDARKNRSFDPLRHSWYRSGDRHYEGRYGARQQYKDVYRRGFQQGYERGFREGRYRY